MNSTDPFDPAADVSASLRTLAGRGELRRYRKGMLLIHEGDRGDSVYIILRGQVRAFTSDEEEREFTFGYYGPGDYMGELSLNGERRSASVIAEETTACAVVTRRMIEEQIAHDPAFAFELLAKVIQRARLLSTRARELSLDSVYVRLVRLLDALAESATDGTRVVSRHCRHQELANVLGCSRAMVTRLLRDLARNGSVAQEGRSIRLLRTLPARW